jgi:putative (di)nucleoside polyphosphate hydrolase
VIDENGFRLNVGLIIASPQNRILWGRRIGNPSAWQFPQGGMDPGETEEESMYRELDEELGLSAEDVQILGKTRQWLSYVLPLCYQQPARQPLCIGQKQKWFLLRLISSDSRIQLDSGASPEFDQWRWVDYWFPLTAVIEFKREVYRQALAEFAPLLGQAEEQ